MILGTLLILLPARCAYQNFGISTECIKRKVVSKQKFICLNAITQNLHWTFCASFVGRRTTFTAIYWTTSVPYCSGHVWYVGIFDTKLVRSNAIISIFQNIKIFPAVYNPPAIIDGRSLRYITPNKENNQLGTSLLNLSEVCDWALRFIRTAHTIQIFTFQMSAVKSIK